MKTNRIIRLSLAFVMLLTLGSCSKTFTFPVSVYTPAADGEVQIKKIKGKAYSFVVNVENLASPSRLTPSKNHYVVWIQDEQGEVQNVGAMELSKKNEATLEGAVNYRPMYIFITAENVINTQWPDNQEIFRSERLRLK